MEEWEREHIRKNLPELTKVTKFRRSLLDKLKAKGVIGDEDIDQLKREGLSAYTRISELYDVLGTRVKGFEALSHSLLADNQTGAYRILQQGVVNQKGTLSDELNCIPLFTCTLPAVDELLDDDNVNVLIVSTPDISLSVKRITDVGPDYLFIHDDKRTRISKRKLESIEEETALVVPCDKLETILKRLDGTQANVVLLTTENDKNVEAAIVSYAQTIRVVKEEICWTDLTPQAQDIILQQSVKFQNRVIHLKEIPAEILSMDELKGQFMFDLLTGMCPELVKSSVPSSPPYYVPRKVASRVSISPEVFQNSGKDVFVVEGVELYQLTNLTRKINGDAVPVDRSSEQRKMLTAQFIQLEHEEDYEDICNLTKSPIHLLSYKLGEFTWRKSHNSLGVIQKYVSETQNHLENEDNFVKRCLTSESPICIADGPGMGKTLLLTRIAEKVMSESASDHCVVRFLILKDLVTKVHSQAKINVDLACEMIAKSSSDFEFGRKIVTRALMSEKVKCHVFLDGYDELLNHQISIVNKMLAFIPQLKNTQLYVSTRLHRCHELEEALITTGCRIQPFDEEDQLTFLTGYWKEAGALKNDSLDGFAKSCLWTLKKSMTKTERDISGIPLQCRLLAELHSKDARQCSEGRKLELKGSPAATLFGMYQSFVNMSFEKVESTVKEPVIRAHVCYAMNLLFPEIEHEFKTTFLQDNLTVADSILLAPGILAKSELEKDARFIHRTLAEFMVAHFVNEFLEEPKPSVGMNIVGVLIQKLLATKERKDIILNITNAFGELSTISQVFEHYVICYFLNSFMLKNSVSSAAHEAAGSAYLIPTLEPSDIFTASVASNLPAIASFLTKLRNFNIENLSWANLFLLAAKYAGTELLSQLTTLAKQQQVQISETNYPVAKTYRKNVDFIVTPLHVAVHWGNYNVTILLLNNHGFNGLLVPENHKTRYLLHTCVMRSYNDAEQVVNDKIQIIKWLCSEVGTTPSNPYRHVLEERQRDGSSPLLQEKVHPKLIQCLIQVVPDINAVNEYKQCVLHTVINRTVGFNHIQFHELVKSLPQTTFKHYDLKSDHYSTPLSWAIMSLDIEMETVDILLEKGADINCIDRWGSSILHQALRKGKSNEFIHQLAVRGANLTCQVNGQNTVIPASVIKTVEYVIEITPSSLNTFARKKLQPDSHEENLECFINAKVELQEMEIHQLSSFVLSLHNPPIGPIPNNTVEPCFAVHSLQSNIIDRKWRSEEHNGWGLAFNYNKLLQNNMLGDVTACTAKVVFMNQELIEKIGKVFEESGMCPIAGVEEIQLKDLPKQTQKLICSKKFDVHREPDQVDAWKDKFPIEEIRGKLLFDLTIANQITLINREETFYLNEREINEYKISTRRNISTSISRTSGSDVFVIQGADLQQLSTLTHGTLTDKSSNQKSLLTARCIQLESEDDFETICNLSKFPVHLLSYHEEKLTWVKSHGSLAVIQQHIHEDQQQFGLAAFVEEMTGEARPTCLAYHVCLSEPESAIVALKKQIYQNERSSVFCLEIDKDCLMNMIASVGPVTPMQFVGEMLSDYALGRELLINAFQAAEYTFHLIFYCKHLFRINQNEMSAIKKIVCYTKPLRNIQLHFIVKSRELLQMEETLQTLGCNFVKTKITIETLS